MGLKKIDDIPMTTGGPDGGGVVMVPRYALDGMIVLMADDWHDGEEWVHVSFSRPDRMPSYDDFKAVRAACFPATAEVIQVFPPEEEFVNHHPYCLHMWWNRDRRVTPKSFQPAVGPRPDRRI